MLQGVLPLPTKKREKLYGCVNNIFVFLLMFYFILFLIILFLVNDRRRDFAVSFLAA